MMTRRLVTLTIHDRSIFRLHKNIDVNQEPLSGARSNACNYQRRQFNNGFGGGGCYISRSLRNDRGGHTLGPN